VSDPLDLWTSAADIGDTDDIETGAEVGELPALLQELQCRANQPPLFAEIHTGGRAPVTIVGTGAHFDNRQSVTLARHDIQLSQTAAKIPIQDFEPAGAQKGDRNLFSPLPDQLAVGSTPCRYAKALSFSLCARRCVCASPGQHP
jgi:hypothetical protein